MSGFTTLPPPIFSELKIGDLCRIPYFSATILHHNRESWTYGWIFAPVASWLHFWERVHNIIMLKQYIKIIEKSAFGRLRIIKIFMTIIKYQYLISCDTSGYITMWQFMNFIVVSVNSCDDAIQFTDEGGCQKSFSIAKRMCFSFRVVYTLPKM